MMTTRIALVAAIAAASAPAVWAQTPPTPPTSGQRGAQPPGGQRGGGGRGAVQVMTLTTTAWADGGQIPIQHAQPGAELSPPLSWSGAPPGTASFVLMVRDLDAVSGEPDGVLHWLVWNIPGSATGLPEGVPHGPQLPDGTRQISVSGPYYRGPAAPSTGPVHHYLFELFALDTTLAVPSVAGTVRVTRAVVVAAMAGRIRGKGVMVGLFRRPPPP